jgi:peptide/nickel transport system ATP-binding protein
MPFATGWILESELNMNEMKPVGHPNEVPVLEIEDLSVSFVSGKTKRPVVVTQGINLQIGDGETLALVGESGSGKSVTAMSILRLLPHNARFSGSIKFCGRELTQLSRNQLSKVRGNEIATVFQDPMTALNPVYKIGDLLGEALHKQGLSSSRAEQAALDLLDRVGIPAPDKKIHHYPHQLSGGQRQRVMIAMAISANPRLLIADEPTTALDVTVQAEILDLLLDLKQENNMALLLITHDMGVVADAADHVTVMRKGSIVENAAVHDLFANPTHDYTKELLRAVSHLGKSAKSVVPYLNPVNGPAHDKTPALRMNDVVIEYRSLSKADTFRAIDKVSFEILPGEVVGLVGESGSGKSTLGRAVVGLVPVADGSVLVDGMDIAKAHKRELRTARQHVSMIFQDPASSLDPRATIGESVVAPLRWNGLERNSRVLAKRAGELLEMVRISPDWSGRYPHELSGGERQRIGIARALALNPKLLVADEPTSALDVSVQASVLELLRTLQSSMGFSCLFISHDLSVIESLADRVVVIHKGRLVEQGSTAAILNDPAQDYTRRLIAAAPVPDPVEQALRRKRRLATR